MEAENRVLRERLTGRKELGISWDGNMKFGPKRAGGSEWAEKTVASRGMAGVKVLKEPGPV